MGFKEGGKYLLGDYVDEGKLVLFIKDEVASRAPRRGRRLNAERERKRKAESPLQPSRPPKQRRGHAGGAISILEEGTTTSPALILCLCTTLSGATALPLMSSGPTRPP